MQTLDSEFNIVEVVVSSLEVTHPHTKVLLIFANQPFFNMHAMRSAVISMSPLTMPVCIPGCMRGNQEDLIRAHYLSGVQRQGP